MIGRWLDVGYSMVEYRKCVVVVDLVFDVCDLLLVVVSRWVFGGVVESGVASRQLLLVECF